MRKVITVNLNGNAYQVEEEAYGALSRYLEDAAHTLSGNPDAAEILADLEQAIADKCVTFLAPHKSVVTAEEVDTILREMGPVETGGARGQAGPGQPGDAPAPDAADAEAQAPDSGAPRRRLYRLKEGSMLGGVCTGLAAYFDTDVVWIRLAFIVLTCITGVSLLVWLAMLIVIPVAYTEQEKALAHGKGTLGTTVNSRRLFRLPDIGRLGGVCAGIAAYFNIDVVLVRVVFVVLTLFTGVWSLLWLALLVLMPVARTPEDFAAAHGDAFSAQDVIDRAKKKSRDTAGAVQAPHAAPRAAGARPDTPDAQLSEPAGPAPEGSAEAPSGAVDAAAPGMRARGGDRQAGYRSWHRRRQRPVGYATQVAAGVSLPLLSAISAILFVAFLVGLFALLGHGPLPLWFGWAHPHGAPRWLLIVALFVVYSMLAGPIGAARRASHRYANGGYSSLWINLLDRLLWIAIVALLLWGLAHYVPWIQQLLEGTFGWEQARSSITVL
jgi:phage shock protein PspC (stress-responsive transcriptional regulator)